MREKFVETELNETIAVIKSGTSAIHICGDDYSRIDEFIVQLALKLGFVDFDEETVGGPGSQQTYKKEIARVVEWNYGYGHVDFGTRAKIGTSGEKISLQQFLEIYKDRKNAEKRIILIRNARQVLEGEMNRENLAQLQQTIVHLKKHLPGRAVLIYCDERRFIPDELSSLVYFLDIKPPSQEELAEITRKELPELKSDIVYQLSSKCVGMSEDSYTQILKKAALDKKNYANAILGIADKTKKQFVDKSGLLKYVEVEVNIDSVGGLDHLKWWLRQKEKAFKNPQEAKEKKIKPAKGILLVGMPGCGKSLTSKAVANFFNYPLLSLDMGSLMGKYVGESEENLRRALKLAENSSPCVLWVDEIEKALAGIGGDESGVSQRLLGYLLTWMNDKTAQVFVMATANDVAVLPPEFLRRGRFDEIFYVDFPNEVERRKIFRIHLGKAIGKETLEKILGSEDAKKKFDDLTRDRKSDETGSDDDVVVNDIEQALRNREFYKEKLEGRFGKKKLEEILDDRYSALKFEELIKDKKHKDDVTKNKKSALPKKVKDYPGTEGYAGSDIEALVNSAVEQAWRQERNTETDILDILIKQRKYMTPLKEVLAEKIARNREKFGQYKLTSASHTKENLQRFETGSDSKDEKELLDLAREEVCPPDTLRKLSKKEFKQVKLAVLDNPNCPPDCIIDLMDDNDADVKAKAEEKQTATPEGMIKIAKDGTKEQKLNLFKRSITEDALICLANSGDKEIVEKILCQSSISTQVWATLIGNAKKDDTIKALLLKHQKFLEAEKSHSRENIEFPSKLRLIRIFEGHSQSVQSVAYSPDGNYIVSGAADNTVKVWDAKIGQLIRTFEGHSQSVQSVAYSPDGNYIVSGSGDNTVKVLDAKTGQLIRTLEGHNYAVLSVAYSPDGNYIVSGSNDETVKVWDIKTGQLIRTFEGHKNAVYSVAYSPDGKYIVSGSGDNTVKVWKAETRELIRTLEGHKNFVGAVAYSPDGKYIVSGSGDNTVKVWWA